MGGSLTIESRSIVHVVVTLKNNGMRHCRDTIQPRGRDDYDLALLDYGIIVEGADEETLQHHSSERSLLELLIMFSLTEWDRNSLVQNRQSSYKTG